MCEVKTLLSFKQLVTIMVTITRSQRSLSLIQSSRSPKQMVVKLSGVQAFFLQHAPESEKTQKKQQTTETAAYSSEPIAVASASAGIAAGEGAGVAIGAEGDFASAAVVVADGEAEAGLGAAEAGSGSAKVSGGRVARKRSLIAFRAAALFLPSSMADHQRCGRIAV